MHIISSRDNPSISIKVNVTFPESSEESNINLSAQLDTKITDLYKRVRSELDVPEKYDISIQLDHAKLLVISGKSIYDPGSRRGLCISADQPLAEYFKEYRAFHGFLPPKDTSKSTISVTNQTRYDTKSEGKFVNYEESTVQVGPASLKFHRTLRVPDNAKNYLLPPGLGTFPLEPVAKFSKSVPDSIKTRGGLLMPMFQREALWIDFAGSDDCAVKISVGGVNAITGQPRDQAPPSSEIQDYVVVPRQPWLDGICTASGVVRQFVAMPLGHGYTIEEQTTGEAKQGGIQIDVYPLLDSSVEFTNSSGKRIDTSLSPCELGIVRGNRISMNLKSKPCVVLEDYVNYINPEPVVQVFCKKRGLTIMLLTGKIFTLQAESSDTVDKIKAMIHNHQGIPPDEQCLVCEGEQLEDGRTLSDYNISPIGSVIHVMLPLLGWGYPPLEEPRMGLAAGGRITQKIYKDTRAVSLYDAEAGERLCVHTVSTTAWERITGVVPPITPIVPGTYQQYDYPWFDLYDERVPGITSTGRFNNVQSVRQLDNASLPPYTAKPMPRLLNPDTPPPCSIHKAATACCVLRPCNHVLCVTCFGQSMMNGSKCDVRGCDKMVEAFVGFKKPIAKVNVGGGSVGNWWAVEDQIDGVAVGEKNGFVVTLLLDEDRVSCLHGNDK